MEMMTYQVLMVRVTTPGAVGAAGQYGEICRLLW